MRIISGNFKGKKIIQPKDLNTRPLKDLTKESIFNIIAHSKKINIKVENSIVLDLFSGVGSFGIECLSRGANYVFFLVVTALPEGVLGWIQGDGPRNLLQKFGLKRKIETYPSLEVNNKEGNNE